MTTCTDDKKTCNSKCFNELGEDPKSKGYIILKYERENINIEINTCITGG